MEALASGAQIADLLLGAAQIEEQRQAVVGAEGQADRPAEEVGLAQRDAAERRRVLKPYQVNAHLMGLADKDALFRGTAARFYRLDV